MSRLSIAMILLFVSTPVRGDGGVEAYVAETLKKHQSAHEDLVRNGYACMATGLLSQPPHNGDEGRIIPALQLTCERADFTTYVSSNKTTATDQSIGSQAPFTRPQTLIQLNYQGYSGNRFRATVESEWELPSELQAFAEPTQQE